MQQPILKWIQIPPMIPYIVNKAFGAILVKESKPRLSISSFTVEKIIKIIVIGTSDKKLFTMPSGTLEGNFNVYFVLINTLLSVLLIILKTSLRN